MDAIEDMKSSNQDKQWRITSNVEIERIDEIANDEHLKFEERQKEEVALPTV